LKPGIDRGLSRNISYSAGEFVFATNIFRLHLLCYVEHKCYF